MVVARVFGIGEEFADAIAAANVAGSGLLEEARKQAERQRMAVERARRRSHFRVSPPYAVVAQERRTGIV